MSDTTHLALPQIEAAQAQKHVTHNEALALLDAFVHLAVLSRTLAAPPATPAQGDRYLVASGATGAWTGHAGELAFWQDGGWRFAVPKSGWRLWSIPEQKLLAFDGSLWRDAAAFSELQNLSLLGVNTSADGQNKLAVASANVLFTHAGADQRLKLNKNAAADTASLLFQDNFSGRAEFGLAGDDDFHVKVSADGSAWNEAMTINRSTGQVALPQGLADNTVSNAGLADMAANRLKGRVAAGSGDPQDLTAAQATAMLDPFTASLKGLAPASGGGATNFLRADGTWTAAVQGPASAADKALPRFNGTTGGLLQNSGVGLTDANELALPMVAAPAAAAAGTVHVFGQSLAGRILPAFRGPSGLERAVQPFLGRSRTARWQANGGGTANSTDGFGGQTGTGTATGRSPASARFFTQVRRVGYVSAATAGASCGLIPSNQLPFWRGNAAGLGGFHAIFTFGISDAATVADARMFAGLQPTTAVIGNVNPSTLINIIGVGCDNGQTTLRLMTNDGTGAATVTDLGGNFPVNTLSTDWYELLLYAAPNGSTIDYLVTRLNTGDIASGTLSSDLPVNSQFLSPQLWRNNGATALAVGLDVGQVYVETDY